MQVVSFGEKFNNPFVLCLGFFDCMHLGHLRLLNRAKKLADGKATALFTFCNNHFQTLKKDTKLLYTFDERLCLYQSLGVDVVISALFDQNFMCVSGKEFLRQILRYPVCGIVCGSDYTCGGDLMSAEQIQMFLRGKVDVDVVETVKDGDTKISSTLVRSLLSQHKIEKADSFLTEPFFFRGVVQHGRHVGTSLGFPTANLLLSADKLAPQGVYEGSVEIAENSDSPLTYKAIVNVGAEPTFGLDIPCVEAHLLGFNGDLYGKIIKVSLLKYIRPIKKFANEAELAAQLRQDKEAVE